MAEALGEFAPHWITLNEPYCSAITGYAEGRHAPGAREGHGALAAAHHLLLGHGLAVPALRARRRRRRVGITLNMSPAVPASDRRRPTAPPPRRQDLLVNRLFTDPVLAGALPGRRGRGLGRPDRLLVRPATGTWRSIAAPLDFLGVNYYYRVHVRDAPTPAAGARTAFDIGVRTRDPGRRRADRAGLADRAGRASTPP